MFVAFEPPGRLKFEGYCKDETPVSYKFYMLELSSKEHHHPHYADGFFGVKTMVLGVTHDKNNEFYWEKLVKTMTLSGREGVPMATAGRKSWVVF